MDTKLNFGCGNKYLDGYINCDYTDNVKHDKLVDLEKFPYDFPDNYADEIILDNVLEHLSDVIDVMRELHRILKKDGVLKIYVPYAKSDWSFQDITHKHFFTERSMDYFEEGNSHAFYMNFHFKIIKKELTSGNHTTSGKLRNLIPFRGMLKNFLFNMYDGVYFELTPLK